MSVTSEAVQSIGTRERVDSRLGSFEYVDGFPSRETSELAYDHLDFVHHPHARLTAGGAC